jgi:hypothetical protein
LFKRELFVKLGAIAEKKMKRAISSVVCWSLVSSLMPMDVWARKLPPADFGQMYSLASSGNLGSLMAAASRGLDLDAPNEDGDSGICVAIKRHDIKAYNTFIKAGASVHPMCVNYMDTAKYKRFMASSSVVKYSDYPTSFQPRENYDWAIVGVATAVTLGVGWVIMNAN